MAQKSQSVFAKKAFISELMHNFRKACDLGEKYCSFRMIEFCISIKIVRLSKRCLNKT
jgi:hypothetical protein